MSSFPDEILEEILSRLPVKCLLRLRCVSKSWLALISSPSFVKMHLNRSAQSKINRSLFLTSFSLIHRVDFDSLDDGVIQPAVVDYHPLNLNRFRVWDSCDGLICISYKTSVFLWNPSTRKSLQLPQDSIDLSTVMYERYFGIDHSCNDYKVVKTVDFLNPLGFWLDYEIFVYSLNSNSWHRSKSKCPQLRKPRTKREQLVVGGALHWTIEMGSKRQKKISIVAFDLRTEKYLVIPQPEYRSLHVETSVHTFEGCLALCCQYHGSKIADIWILKEYGGKDESWSRLITMLPIIPTRTRYLAPIAYSKSGKKVLLEMDYKKVFWYNLEQKSVEHIMIHGLEEGKDSFVGLPCIESLVSVDVTAAAANAKSAQEEDSFMLRVIKKMKRIFWS